MVREPLLAPGESELPTGTVTFLFTDVVGSTVLWETAPQATAAAMARHDALIEAAVASHRGVVVRPRGEGDSRFAVFSDARAAVGAALAIVRSLGNEPWPTPRSIEVRIALHTGSTDVRLGDYYGPDVNRAARLRAIGHPGQILISGSTAALAGRALPPGARLVDLGAHRLKDLSAPEQVFQLAHPDLVEDFPPLASLDRRRHNLPVALSSFVGRAVEMIEVPKLLANTRLLTLVGAGGSGKTRLSLEAAAAVVDGFDDGVWLVELAPLADPVLVPQAIASALGVREEPGRDLLATLVDFVADKALLVVLDNCEHVVEAAAAAVAQLLAASPGLRVLATSREPLGIVGETTWGVPSLETPDPLHLPPLEVMASYEAVQLFVARAQAARPSFLLDTANAAPVAQICRRLDGIPLAIELAAARVRSLAPATIAARLDDRFRLLTGGSRSALPRQQTLHAAVDWSYRLLSPPEQVIFRRLAVFAGGAGLDAAEAVCSGGEVEEVDVVDLLSQLVGKSLVVAEEAADTTRYRMLETIRQFAAERLAESGEAARFARRHASWMLSLIEETNAREYFSGDARDNEWVHCLRREQDNARAALASSIDAGATELALRLAGPLWKLWYATGEASEGRRWLDAALSLDGPASPSALGRGLLAAGMLAQGQGDYDGARRALEKSHTVWAAGAEPASRAFLLTRLGSSFAEQGDFDLARPILDQGLAAARQAEDPGAIALTLNNVGEMAMYEGDYVRAKSMLEESLRLSVQLDDHFVSAWTLAILGVVLGRLGDVAGARSRLDESLAIGLERDFKEVVAVAWHGAGSVRISARDYAKAEHAFREALSFWGESRDQRSIAQAMEGLAATAAASGQLARAACLFGVAHRIRHVISVPVYPHERAEYDTHLGMVKRGLGPEEFEAAWAKAEAMSIDDGVEYALAMGVDCQPPG